MHYVWQHRLLLQKDMVTTDGERVEVIDPGVLNRDAGPDFFNAKVRIGERMWCGNVEMHVRASDWHRHGHDGDHAYDSVVLHVVGADDCRIELPGGRVVPQMVMQCAPDFNERYREMVDGPSDRLACFDELSKAPRVYVTDCITAMAFERLHDKVNRIAALLDRAGGNWPETVYVTLARALGFGLNSQAFEQLALALPLRTLLKHRDSDEAVQGLLFGQAGLLPQGPVDDTRVELLRREYEFLCRKFGLKAPDGVMWRMARTRPQNFPHRRIAALGAMVIDGFAVASQVCYVENLEQARALFDVQLPYYWRHRYGFGEAHDPVSTGAFSRASVDVLVINVVVPLLYVYGSRYGEASKQDLAVALLEQLPAERNSITRLFAEAGVECRDAFTSQALIQLRRAYCEPRKCLYCRLGHQFLSQKAKYRPGGSI